MKYTKPNHKTQAQNKETAQLRSFLFYELLTYTFKDWLKDSLSQSRIKILDDLLPYRLKRVTCTEKTLLAIVWLYRQYGCFSIKQQAIAQALGHRRETVNKSLAILKRHNLVRWHSRHRRTNYFYISTWFRERWYRATSQLHVTPLDIIRKKDYLLEVMIEKTRSVFSSYRERYQEFLYRLSHPLLE